jgi:SAM-dependent methyltransferase
MLRSRFVVLVLVTSSVLGLVAGVLGVVAFARRGHGTGRSVPGGILIGDTGTYDRLSRILMGGLFRGIAADVAAAAPAEAKVLEVGCGPGLLSIRLARSHGLQVTGLDLDRAMIDRATANTKAEAWDDGAPPTFVVGDVAALPFPDGSFDLAVSTFSMHHWDDPAVGLREIARVLRPGGRALIWDLRPGILPFHPEVFDAGSALSDSPLGPATVTPWHWPGPLSLAQRAAFRRD